MRDLPGPRREPHPACFACEDRNAEKEPCACGVTTPAVLDRDLERPVRGESAEEEIAFQRPCIERRTVTRKSPRATLHRRSNRSSRGIARGAGAEMLRAGRNVRLDAPGYGEGPRDSQRRSGRTRPGWRCSVARRHLAVSRRTQPMRQQRYYCDNGGLCYRS